MWTRIVITRIGFNYVVVDATVECFRFKYGIPGNAMESKRAHLNPARIPRMVERLTARGWAIVSDERGVTTLVRDQ